MVSKMNETGNNMNFKANTTYTSRFVTDADSTFEVRVIKVTPKTVTFIHPQHGDETRAKVHNMGEGDFFYPLGQYSMAPVVRA